MRTQLPLAKGRKRANRGPGKLDSVYMVSGSLYELARSRGLPERLARQVIGYAPPQHGHAEHFETKESRERASKLEGAEWLSWLLDFFQDGYDAAVGRREGWDIWLFLWGYAPQRVKLPSAP